MPTQGPKRSIFMDNENHEVTSKAILGAFVISAITVVVIVSWIGIILVPKINGLDHSIKSIQSRLETIEKLSALSYFSRDPGKTTLEEALSFLRFWTEEETKCHPYEVQDAHRKQEIAIKALEALGKPVSGRLWDEIVSPGKHKGAKYYKRALMKLLMRLDRRKGIEAARTVLEGSEYSPQTRIFAARILLEHARDMAVSSLRRIVRENNHLTLSGYNEFLHIYLNRTSDGARGKIVLEILKRRTMDISTALEIVKSLPSLDRRDKEFKIIIQQLIHLYFHDDMQYFNSAVLLRPLPPHLSRFIVRTLGEVLPPEQLKVFLDKALKVETNEGTRTEILKYLREKCK